ncbi:zinc ribbon domain-containing protein [Oceanobacillus piezotolerans]|uniref:Zinc ribbon domain-containing protein n=1 Tax=Oceanobacillus piezotolerans TaxID=2448030 RepID=A0A498D683_9BACI|nr:zinc ribbon domain-containing protein [Oceanobacillus piezotolerans]RLL45169.1 zinc ribbon domain-containing protein [Oceanobacillus piezotolerans]
MHCPHCGTLVKEEELYCVKCGNKLPSDMELRVGRKEKNRYWFIPLLAIIIMTVITSIFYLVLQTNSARSMDYYNQGEQELLDGNYEAAASMFNQAMKYNRSFQQAEISLEYLEAVQRIEQMLTDAESKAANGDFQEALGIYSEIDNELKLYNGEAVNQLVQFMNENRDSTKIAQINSALNNEPTIDDLKILLWEAESVGEKASDITSSIRNQIIDYSFTKASESLSNKYFREASFFVEDGMKYAPDSEKLSSLHTTIEKEKVAFETAQQQRIEQAMSIAQEDYERNENDAIELLEANIEKDQQGNLVVKGKVKSVATIPTNSTVIEYSLMNEQEMEILSNEVFVYPDTLYPGETGEFEFTHYDIKDQSLTVKVNKITWYTD